MATKTARLFHTQQVHYLRAAVTYADNGVVKQLGTIPAGSLILKPISGLHVVTAFNAGTSNVIDIGTSADDDLFGTDMALGTAGFIPLDEAIGGYYVSADTDMTATVALSGTAATAGSGVIVIAYIPNNDG